MIAKINSTGTHIHKGKLKVRVDLYPSITDKTYLIHFVDHLDREPTKEEIEDPVLMALLSTHKELNPCLCHFIWIAENTELSELENYLRKMFTDDFLASLDSALILPDSAHRISRPLKILPSLSSKLTKTIYPDDLIKAVSERLAGFEVSISSSGEVTLLEPQTIDVGAGATDRTGSAGNNLTSLNIANPANASGTVNVLEFWSVTNLANVKGGLWYGTAPNFACRDFEVIGAVTSGSKQTFSGLDIDCQTNDVIGMYSSGGTMEWSTAGGSGVYRLAGDNTDGGTDEYTTHEVDDDFSEYGTGTEAVAGAVGRLVYGGLVNSGLVGGRLT